VFCDRASHNTDARPAPAPGGYSDGCCAGRRHVRRQTMTLRRGRRSPVRESCGAGRFHAARPVISPISCGSSASTRVRRRRRADDDVARQQQPDLQRRVERFGQAGGVAGRRCWSAGSAAQHGRAIAGSLAARGERLAAQSDVATVTPASASAARRVSAVVVPNCRYTMEPEASAITV